MPFLVPLAVGIGSFAVAAAPTIGAIATGVSAVTGLLRGFGGSSGGGGAAPPGLPAPTPAPDFAAAQEESRREESLRRRLQTQTNFARQRRNLLSTETGGVQKKTLLGA